MLSRFFSAQSTKIMRDKSYGKILLQRICFTVESRSFRKIENDFQILYGETCEILETEGISVKSKWILMVMKVG